MVLKQCFIIIVAFSLSSAAACTDANGYLYSAITDANHKFTASFCRSGTNDTAIIESTSTVCNCDPGSSCMGENFELYRPGTGISISNTATSTFPHTKNQY